MIGINIKKLSYYYKRICSIGSFFMVILEKKRIMMVASCVILATFVFVFQTASKEKTVETVALPVTNKVVVLDAGHGEPDRWRRK